MSLGQEMLARLQGLSAGMTHLRVGSVATLSRNYQENWLRPALAHPDVVLTLESGLLDWLLERLRRHQLDVVLANEAVPADLIVVGIGVTPSTGWLEDSGLQIDNGVACDEHLFAAPGIDIGEREQPPAQARDAF